MRCKFCKEATITETSFELYKCPVCNAEYQMRGKTGKVVFDVISEPDPEIDNLLIVRERLNEAQSLLILHPEQALELIQDIWVELTALIKGSGHSEIQVLTDKIRDLEDQLELE